MDQKYLTDSESLSLNIEATCLLLSSPRNFQYEIKTDKYNPYPSMISMFTSDSQHPPKSRHAVHLGESVGQCLTFHYLISTCKIPVKLTVNAESRRKVKISCELTVKLFTCVRLIKLNNNFFVLCTNEKYWLELSMNIHEGTG